MSDSDIVKTSCKKATRTSTGWTGSSLGRAIPGISPDAVEEIERETELREAGQSE